MKLVASACIWMLNAMTLSNAKLRLLTPNDHKEVPVNEFKYLATIEAKLVNGEWTNKWSAFQIQKLECIIWGLPYYIEIIHSLYFMRGFQWFTINTVQSKPPQISLFGNLKKPRRYYNPSTCLSRSQMRKDWWLVASNSTSRYLPLILPTYHCQYCYPTVNLY